MITIPFKSAKQRRYMHKHHPEIAARWERDYGSKSTKRKSTAKRKKAK